MAKHCHKTEAGTTEQQKSLCYAPQWKKKNVPGTKEEKLPEIQISI